MNNKRTEEYIDLAVLIDDKEVDIHLQGSGLLQILEIFSSIEYFESALNIVLLDEPDAHIHTTLQRNLINSLKNDGEKNQIFVISHNEKFVDSIADNASLYYLNKYVKEETFKLDILNNTSRLKIKSELGNIISSLDEIQDASKIILVEGTGDKEFLNLLSSQYFSLFEDKHKTINVHFIQVRGKDKLKDKIDFLVQLLPQLLNDKKIGIIADKDYTTLTKMAEHEKVLTDSLKQYKDFIYIHPSYCMESTLLTEPSKLINFIASDINKDDTFVESLYQGFTTSYIEAVKNVTSSENEKFTARFNSQQKNRDELKGLTVSDVIRDLTSAGVEYVITKQLLSEFLGQIRSNLDESYDLSNSFNYGTGTSSDFLEYYVRKMNSQTDFYECHKELINLIYDIT